MINSQIYSRQESNRQKQKAIIVKMPKSSLFLSNIWDIWPSWFPKARECILSTVSTAATWNSCFMRQQLFSTLIRFLWFLFLSLASLFLVWHICYSRRKLEYLSFSNSNFDIRNLLRLPSYFDFRFPNQAPHK